MPPLGTFSGFQHHSALSPRCDVIHGKTDYSLYLTVATPTASNMAFDMLALPTINVTHSLNSTKTLKPISTAAVLSFTLTLLWSMKSSTTVTASLQVFEHTLQQSHWPHKHRGESSTETCINNQHPRNSLLLPHVCQASNGIETSSHENFNRVIIGASGGSLPLLLSPNWLTSLSFSISDNQRQ